MIIPVGDRVDQELIFLAKSKGKIREDHRIPVVFVPMNMI